jgi:uncharacterized coiled-coil protein SlyX
MDISMSKNKDQRQHQQSSDFPTTGYEAAEEERKALRGEERNASVPEEQEEEEEEELPPESATQHKRSERREGKRSRNDATTIATAATAWQVTLIDLDKQLNKQSRLMERMSDDIRHLRKRFNQVQRDLSKFEKRMQKMNITPPSSTKRRKQRG